MAELDTKTVTGEVILPNSTGWAGGIIHVQLSAPATVDDDGTEKVVHGNFIVVIGSDGTVNFELAPNDIMTPADTVYILRYTSPSGLQFAEYVTVAAADADPIDIGDLTRAVAIPGGYAAGTLAALTDTNVPSPGDLQALVYDAATGKWVPGTVSASIDFHADTLPVTVPTTPKLFFLTTPRELYISTPPEGGGTPWIWSPII